MTFPPEFVVEYRLFRMTLGRNMKPVRSFDQLDDAVEYARRNIPRGLARIAIFRGSTILNGHTQHVYPVR